jgi:hypothetical protein
MSKAPKHKFFAGKRFGSWTLLRVVGEDPRTARCRCDCGVERDVRRSALLCGGSLSCGCTRTKHRASAHVLYRRWAVYRRRGRLCPEWAADCAAFVRAVEALDGYAPGTGFVAPVDPTRTMLSPDNIRWRLWCAPDRLRETWRRAKKRGDLCPEWSADYLGFVAGVSALPGCGTPKAELRAVDEDRPIGPDNVRWGVPGKDLVRQREPLYMRWRTARSLGVLCPEWAASFKAYKAAVTSLPGYDLQAQLKRKDASRAFSPDNAYWEAPHEAQGSDLHVRWRTLRAAGKLAPEWVEDYAAFASAVEALPGYGPGCQLRRRSPILPFAPGNVYALPTGGEGDAKHLLYARWVTARATGILCPAWQAFDVFVSDVEALPGYDASGRLTRLKKRRPFGPDNARWILAPAVSSAHPLYMCWHRLRFEGIICPEWAADCAAFVAAVEALAGYGEKGQLRRIDASQHFSPGNIRWLCR